MVFVPFRIDTGPLKRDSARRARYLVRRIPEPPLCSCEQTVASYQLVDPVGEVIGLYCSTCAEQIADDYNAGLEDEESEA